jgi:sugar phosphate permease
VPPTVALVADRFGRAHVGAVFGWVFFAHQVGAAFLGAGVLAILVPLMVLVIRREDTTPGPGTARA